MPRKAQTESLADRNPAPGGAAAVDRALSLLAVFRAGDTSVSLAELSSRTGLYKSTILRLLASLEHACLLHRLDNGSYTLGSEIARLSTIYAASLSLEGAVMPVLHELVGKTGESAAFHVRQGQARLCLCRVDSPHPIRDHIKAGDVLPMDRGTGARVLIAFGPASTRDNVRVPPKEQALYAKIRRQGYYSAVGDRLAQVAGISAPVFRSNGDLTGALTLTMPAARYRKGYVNEVVQLASKLSGQL